MTLLPDTEKFVRHRPPEVSRSKKHRTALRLGLLRALERTRGTALEGAGIRAGSRALWLHRAGRGHGSAPRVKLALLRNVRLGQLRGFAMYCNEYFLKSKSDTKLSYHNITILHDTVPANKYIRVPLAALLAGFHRGAVLRR